eukprot:scaffold39067_cov63-Phaeocystis_antarctica.AAC.1
MVSKTTRVEKKQSVLSGGTLKVIYPPLYLNRERVLGCSAEPSLRVNYQSALRLRPASLLLLVKLRLVRLRCPSPLLCPTSPRCDRTPHSSSSAPPPL